MTDKPILLIVDDQPDNLVVLSRVVETLLPGCAVVTAPSGEKGVAVAAENNLDAALIDVQMPGMDGIEMCRKLKADPGNQHTPIILIIARGASAEIKAQGLEAGADDFISRPIDNEELAARIKVALRIKRAEDDLRSLNASLETKVAERTAELAFANQQLRAECDRAQNLVEIAPTIILELDLEGRIVTFNPYFEELSGFCLDEIKGWNWLETCVPERERQRITKVIERAVTGAQTSGNVNPILTKDGRERDIIWFNRALKDSEGHVGGLLSMGQDITDIRRAEKVEWVLGRILRAAVRSSDPHDLIGEIRDLLANLIDTTNFFVALYDQEDETYAFPFIADEKINISPNERIALPGSLTERVRQSAKPLLVDDLSRPALTAEGLTECGPPSRSWLGVPLEGERGIIGVLAVQSYTDSQLFTDEDLNLLHHAAETISLVLERYLAEQQTVRLGRVLEDSVNEIYIFDTESLRFIQANRGATANIGYTESELKTMTPVDLTPEFTEEAFAEVIEPLKTGSVERLQFSTAHRRKDGTLYAVEVNLSLVSAGGRPVFISVILDITERQENEAELERYRRRLEEMVEQRSQDLLRARDLTEGINEILYLALTCEDEREVSQVCLNVARRLTGAAFGFIGEVNERSRFDTLALDHPAWDRCRIPETHTSVMMLDMEIRGIWGTVIISGQPLIIDDPTSHQDSIGVPEGHPELKSFLGVPLVLRGETVGMLALANKEGGFSEADQDVSMALATAFFQALMRLRAEQEVGRRSRERQKALDLMVGRELRMAELKQEMRALEAENLRLKEELGCSGESAQ